MSLTLRNPHSVLAALKHRPKAVQQVFLPIDTKNMGDGWAEVSKLAQSHKIPVSKAPPAEREGRRGSAPQDGGRTHGIGGLVREKEPVSIQSLFTPPAEGKFGVWLALDQVQDPQNLGSLFRTAAFFGVRGILMTQDRSSPLTAPVYDVACGGVEEVPYALEVNLQRAIDQAKESGLWVLGTSEHAKDSLFKLDRDRNWLIVLGNEESGMRALTQKSCDLLCTIPVPKSATGGVSSLNVSVANAVLLSHFCR